MKLFGSRRVYLDHAGATPVRPEAAQAYREAVSLVGNPGAIHTEGREAAQALLDARERIGRELGCKAREIVFTSGLTESNNLALLGLASHLERTREARFSGTHWIVSSIEHQSVLAAFEEIERRGGRVTYVDPDARGVVATDAIERALRKETVCVSVGWANSEIGVIQPLRDISHAIRRHEASNTAAITFHSDAGQAPLYLSASVHTLGVDILALGSGKLYGPRGIGALYIGGRVELAPLAIGGGQERGLRAGTESPALAVGFASALEIAGAERRAEGERLVALRDWTARCLLERIPGVVINGDLRRALPHMLNISIPNMQSEYVLLALDQKGIACSTKSACSEGRMNESHVVAAIARAAKDSWRARNTLRLSFGLGSRPRDAERFVEMLAHILKHLPIGGV